MDTKILRGGYEFARLIIILRQGMKKITIFLLNNKLITSRPFLTTCSVSKHNFFCNCLNQKKILVNEI